MIERASDDPDVQKIVRLISNDVGLSAALLKTVNSPFYGLRSKIGSIQQAVSMLGMKNVGTLVMGLALRSSIPMEGLQQFWDSAARSAQLAGMLAKNRATMLIEEAHLYTLFHDSAMPILLQRFPEYRQTMRDIHKHTWIEVTYLEDSRHNTNHAVVGGLLASNWGLPAQIREAIQLHHDISVFGDHALHPDIATLIALGHVAEHVENAISQHMNDNVWEEFGDLCRDHLEMDEDDLRDFTDNARDLFGMNEY
jgi:HD-like signal output (HDOD) protein